MLTTDEVVMAGAALAREHGLAALGVRALAARLEVTPMALYRHLRGSEALEKAVLDALLADLPLAEAKGPPLQRMREWAVQARKSLTRCRGLAHHLLLHWFEQPRALEAVESLLACAEELGLQGFESVAAANAIFTYALMRAQLEESLKAGNAINRKLPALKNLPRVARNAAEYKVARIDAHFDYGLDLLLRGLRP